MNVSLSSMLKLLWRIVEMNNTGVTGRILLPNILTLSMRAFGPRNSAYAFWTTTDIYVYITRNLDWTPQCGARFARPISLMEHLVYYVGMLTVNKTLQVLQFFCIKQWIGKGVGVEWGGGGGGGAFSWRSEIHTYVLGLLKSFFFITNFFYRYLNSLQ